MRVVPIARIAAWRSALLLPIAGAAALLALAMISPAPAPAAGACNAYLEPCTHEPSGPRPKVSLVLGKKCLKGTYIVRPKITGGRAALMKAWIGRKHVARVGRPPFRFRFSTYELRPHHRYRMKITVRFKTGVWRSTTAWFRTC